MKTLSAKHYLLNIGIDRAKVPSFDRYPKATIYSLEDQAIRKVSYKETEHYAVTRRFLADPEAMLGQLLGD